MKQLKQGKKRSQVKEFPYIVNNKNRISLALKFFLNKKKSKSEVAMYKRLTPDLLAAANKSGASPEKRKNLYEYAFLKKKYFYYR